MLLLSGLLFVGGLVVFAGDWRRSETAISKKVLRQEGGHGSKLREWEVRIEGERARYPVKVAVSERIYDKKEIKKLFSRVIKRIESEMLGKNQNPEQIEYDLNLMNRISGEPVEISWTTEDFQIIDARGRIKTKGMGSKGKPVALKARIIYTGNRKEQMEYRRAVRVVPPVSDKRRQRKQDIAYAVEKREGENRKEKVFWLPEKIGGRRVDYYPKRESRGLVLAGMAVLTGGLAYGMQYQTRREKEKERKRQMTLDYPEILSKLAVYIGAGMTTKRAWRLVAYGRKRQGQPRYVYGEMQKTLREIESGKTEGKSYEDFGKNCGTQEYLRLGALLSQNLKKGTQGLGGLLHAEAVQAFEERKARARKAGEEASTKLLLPMFLMLLTVLIIVMTPAFLSLQI
ncbi:hypothetical protein [Suipraeoptans intestinalis]|uniref:hypothetical protein n=1 Tax=Suipraeoptans intestinalis TaxID=2606628 RepID=UPI0023F4C20E|nr:hypothetical protein [Suipraeoptans intestinalis]